MKKRAKRVKIIYTKKEITISRYTCPHCKRYIIGAGINKNIIRFLCTECGNELIIDKDKR